MSTRALLALMVLLGTMAFQIGVAEVPGRAATGSSFYLHYKSVPPGELVSYPPADSWIDMANNTSAEFRLTGFSGLYDDSGKFELNLSFASLNHSGLELAFTALLDADGDGATETTVRFQGCTTSIAKEVEHLARGVDNLTGAPRDFRNGTVRLLVNRTDLSDGLLRFFTGNGANASMLTIPYGAPLIASAGDDRQAKVNQTVTFNASRSRAVDPAHTQYIWDFDSSNGLGTDAVGIAADHAYLAPGVYNVSLTLMWAGYLDRDTIAVNVTRNIPPIADAGRNVTQRRGTPIAFHGSGVDPDGTVVSYEWDFGDGANASGQNVTHAYSASGNYTVALIIRDNEGAYGTDSMGVHINHPPSLVSLNFIYSGRTINFRALAADPDANDTLLRYAWSFGDGAAGTGGAPSHRYASSGDFLVCCTVFDPLDDSATGYLNVSITNSPPVIASLGGLSEVGVNEYIHFRPATYDPDGDQLNYSWDFGDRTTSRNPEPFKSYPKAGTYHVILELSDGQEATRSSMDIKVNEANTTSPDMAATVLGMACLGVIGIVVVAVLVWAISRKRPEPAQHPYYGYQGQPPPSPYQGYGGPQPVLGPPAPRARPAAPAAPPGACPRCGSRDITSFGDGHAKCNNCKKILYTG